MKAKKPFPGYGRRRTLAAYKALYHNGTLLAPSQDPKAYASAEVTLFPNGSREIWVEDARGLGFSIRVSSGPHGIGIEVTRFIATPDLVETFATDGSISARSFHVTQYATDEASQLYRQWYFMPDGPERIAVRKRYDKLMADAGAEV